MSMETNEQHSKPATIEERIRHIMETQGMNQQMFAERTGIAPATLSNIFKGRTRATNNQTMALHRAFPNLNVNWLLFGEGEMFGLPHTAEHPTATSSDPSSKADGAVPSRPCQSSFAVEGSIVPQAAKQRSQTDGCLRDGCKGDALSSSGATALPLDVPVSSERKHRRVEEIRVFYDDGTYEVFTPQ